MAKEKTAPQILFGNVTTPELPLTTYPSTWYEKVRAMRKDPTIALVRQLVLAPMLAGSWVIEGDDPEQVDFIDEMMQPLHNHIIRQSWYGMMDFGWSPFEKIFVNDGESIKLKKLKPLLQDFTEILIDPENGAFAGLEQPHPTKGEVILKLPQCFLAYLDPEGTDWYGQSLMQNVEAAYDAWLTVDKAATRYDNKVAGAHWIVHYPAGFSTVNGTETDNFTVAKQILSQLESSGSVAVPRVIADYIDDLNKDATSAWEIELHSATGNVSAGFVSRQKYLDALKVRGLGLTERSVLEGQFGTKAEAEAHADFAIMNLVVRHEDLVQLINWHVVNQILRLNFGPESENKTKIVVSPIADTELVLLKEVYSEFLKLSPGEIDNIDSRALKEKLNIPFIEEEDELTEEEELF